MSDSNVIIYPKELRNASNYAKECYVEWIKLSDEIENHPLKFFTVVDAIGDSHTVDCAGVWKMLHNKFDKLQGIPKEDYEEVKRRCTEIQKLKTQKSVANRRWNSEVDSKHGKGTVLEFRKQDILELFGQYKSIEQVMSTIKEWGLRTSKTSLISFYYENKQEIDDRRQRFIASEKDYYLATGTGRIESLSYLYSKLMDKFDENQQVKYAAEIRAIIEQVRKEVKGDEIRLTVDGKIDITATTNANMTIHEFNQRLSVNMFIIGLVSAKKGINPTYIMSQLGNSFYADYNGFSELKPKEEMQLPSHFINSYNWGEIEEMHKEKEKKATTKIMDEKLSKFFSDNNIKYTGNFRESLEKLEKVIAGEAVPEIVDVEPIEIEVAEEIKPEIKTKRDLLKQILAERKKDVKNT